MVSGLNLAAGTPTLGLLFFYVFDFSAAPHPNRHDREATMAQNGSLDSTTAHAKSLETNDSAEKSDSTSNTTMAKVTEDATVNLQELISFILQFLSDATNETLAACFIGLVVSTYIVFGRLGLILIGVVGGVILHASWEEHSKTQIDEVLNVSDTKDRRERGLGVIRRILGGPDNIRAADTGSELALTQQDSSPSSTEPDFSSFQPDTAAALANLTDAVIRDYVKWWYSPLLPSDNLFMSSCRRLFTRFLLAISSHLARKRPADVFLDFLTNSSSIIIVFLHELSTAALTSPGTYNDDFSKALYRYLEASPESNLANVLDVEQQSKKLRAISEDILQKFLEPTAYACDPVKIFLREVLAGLILEATVKRCSDAGWINGWIIYLLEDGEPELLTAIDVGVSGTGNIASKEASSISANGLTHYNERTSDHTSKLEHRRTLSRAESAMEEAMQEAKRLSELIAAEEASKKQHADGSIPSENTTQITPTSSQSDLDRFNDDPPPIPADGNVITMHSNEPASIFTSFDQIISRGRSSTLQSDSSGLRSSPIAPRTLHNANVSIFDDGEKASARAKPTAEFLLQIEPVSSQYPGWMIARKYTDFETLHEVLRRISVVSGVPEFAQKHGNLPSWKSLTKSSLRNGLESYLQDALSYDRLAESEGMKRFLEKDQGNARTSPSAHKGGFSFPSPAAFESMGKGMLDVLASAPKGAAGGGKAILGGVSGVLGGVGSLGQRRQSQATSPYGPRIDDANSTPPAGPVRKSQDSVRSSFSLPGEARRPPPLPPRSSVHIQTREEGVSSLKQIVPEAALGITLQNGSPTKPSIYHPTREEKFQLHLPPPPSEIPDDYNTIETSAAANELPIAYDCVVNPSPIAEPATTRQNTSPARPPEPPGNPIPLPKREKPSPLDRKETQVAIELFFAVINQLYTLSSAWNIRRTLLNAAKGFLLRPGNPKLEDIRLLLQKTMIDANTSDANLAAHISKLRANTMPTEEELNTWPPPLTDGEKEILKLKARKLLVERGMPQALTAVMGAAASGEALGRVFDALQIQVVARGFMFALLQQGVRAITQ